MGDFFKGLGSVVLGGLVGSCLGAAAFLSVEGLMHRKANADETWIEVHRDVKPPKPGTKAEFLDWWGTLAWVDARSIVRRGDYVFYNWTVKLITKDEIYAIPEKGTLVAGVKANCRTKTIYFPAGPKPFKPDSPQSDAARFACGN